MKRAAVVTVAALVAILVGATAGSAAWTATGKGSGSSKSMRLVPPGAVTVSAVTATGATVAAGAGTTAVGVLAPNSFRVDRTLVSDSSVASDVCHYTPAQGSCTDTSAAASTAYRYSVVARYSQTVNTAPFWTSAATQAAANTTTTAVTTTTFAVTSASSSQVAGTSFVMTVTAKKNGVTDTTYVGKATTFSGPASSPNSTVPLYSPASGSTLNFSSGVATVTVTLYKAGATSITVADSASTGTLSGLTVSAAKVQITMSCPASGAKGADVTVSAARATTDPYGNADANAANTMTVTMSGTAGKFASSNNANLTVTVPGGSTSTGSQTFSLNGGTGTSSITTDGPTGYTAATGTAGCSITHT